MILLNTLIPISLYVNVELLKLVVSFWINWDVMMYHQGADKSANVNNTAITEELGQIEYVLSDKTGTLTQNKMELLRVVIDKKQYGSSYTEIELAEAGDSGEPLYQPKRTIYKHEEAFKDSGFHDERVNGLNWRNGENPEAQKDFWIALALCNQVIISCTLYCACLESD